MQCALGYGLSFNLPNDGRNIVKFLTDFSFFESIMNENLSTYVEGFYTQFCYSSTNSI